MTLPSLQAAKCGRDTGRGAERTVPVNRFVGRASDANDFLI